MGMAWYNGFSPKEREKGNRIIKKAIKNGELPDLRTQKCNICGQDKGVRHYHNEDYTPKNIIKDAIPICFQCHMHLHAKNKDTLKYKKYEEKIKNGGKSKPVYTKYWTKEYEKFEINTFKQTKLI